MTRDQIIDKLQTSGVGNLETARALADLLLHQTDKQFRDMQCNYSALMYLITEQQALIGNLLGKLLAAGTIGTLDVEKITDVYGNTEVLTPVYNDLYKRFAWYFIRVREVLAEQDKKGPDKWNPGSPKPPKENKDDRR